MQVHKFVCFLIEDNKFNEHLNELIVLLFSVTESKQSLFFSFDGNTTSQMLHPFQIIRRVAFFRYIAFTMYLDSVYLNAW